MPILPLNITTLSSRVDQNTLDIANISSELSIVGALARNANMYAHSHGWSDYRLKKEIVPINNALKDVLKLQGVRFSWKPDEANIIQDLPSGSQIGFIAQDIEKVFPELETTDTNGYKLLDYAKLTPILVEAIKEQQVQIDFLKQQNIELQARLEALDRRIGENQSP